MTPKHQAARHLAEQGIPVFPVRVNGKKPLSGSNGYRDATTTLAQIDAWWGSADYNVAIYPAPAGLCIIDLDGDEGLENWQRLEDQQPEPILTRAVETPGGGMHLYFKGQLPASAS